MPEIETRHDSEGMTGAQLFEQDQIHDCTGFCTDWLRLALTGRYCSLRGVCRDVVEQKDKRFIIRNL